MPSSSVPFIDLLFGTKPDNLYILIFTLPGKESYWCRTSADATQQALALAGTTPQNVYVMMSLSTDDRGLHARGVETCAAGIAGLWLDIDYAGPGHTKPNLPPTAQEAQDLIDEMPLPPTIVVFSGGGLQCYWLFDQLWLFADQADRERAKALTTAWNQLFIRISKSHGYAADSVGDLTRVLRVPGTVNRKIADHPVTVEMTDVYPDRRYTIADFEGLPVLQIPAPVTKPARVATTLPLPTPQTGSDTWTATARFPQCGDLTIAYTVKPPEDKWDALRCNEPAAERAFLHKTPSRLQNDQSASSYDMALCNFAIDAQWSDQEMCDLILAHRLYHNCDMKRPEYYARTISNARATHYQREIRDALGDEHSVPDDLEPAERRALLLGELSGNFGLEITRIQKYMTDPPSYRIETARGAIALKTIDDLVNETKLRSNIAAAAGVFFPILKKTWPVVAQKLLDCCEEQDAGVETTQKGIVANWLREYLRERKPMDDIEQALRGGFPFTHEGGTYVVGMEIRRWLNVDWQEKISPQELGTHLKMYGCTVQKFPVGTGSERVTVSAWRIPRETAEVTAEVTT